MLRVNVNAKSHGITAGQHGTQIEKNEGKSNPDNLKGSVDVAGYMHKKFTNRGQHTAQSAIRQTQLSLGQMLQSNGILASYCALSAIKPTLDPRFHLKSGHPHKY